MSNKIYPHGENDASVSSLICNNYSSWNNNDYKVTNIEIQSQHFELQANDIQGVKKVTICDRPEVIYVSADEVNEKSVLYLKSSKRNRLHVKRKLGSKIAAIGETITFIAEFKSEILKCLWYKDDIPVQDNNNLTMTTVDNKTICCIRNINSNDSGYYTAVTKIKHGITATTGVVLVVEQKLKEMAPRFEERFYNATGFEYTDLRLDCKVCPLNASIQWYRDDHEIFDNNDIVFEDFGGGYISLTIINPGRELSGIYRCKISNGSGAETCSCEVKFIEPRYCDIHSNSNFTVLRHLPDILVSLGAEVSLEAQFEVTELSNYQTMWIVGRHKITTGTQNSKLFTPSICNNKFRLQIHMVQLDMAGEVQCQLRCSGTCNQFCIVKTISFLTIVPSVLLDTDLRSIKSCRPIVKMSSKVVNVGLGSDVKLHADIDSILAITAVMWYHSDSKIEVDSARTSFRFKIINNEDHTILIIKNVTFDDIGKYKVIVKNLEGPGTAVADLVVWEMPDTPIHSPQLQLSLQNDILTITLSWQPSVDGSWYEVEQNKKGIFTQVMKVSKPKAVFPNIPRGEERQYRYRVVNPVFVGEPSPLVDVCIEYPAPPDEQLNMKLQDIEEYIHNYTAQDVLGSGSFGKVILVTENATGNQFAAKIMKTKISKKRTAALREFEILKTLSHDKIIQIFACYSEKNQVVIVTEYLSGGELFERVLQEDCVTEADCVMYMRQVCVGVAYLHSKSIVHLDLKAENIMCVAKNSKQVKIIDLGLAHYVREGSAELRAMYGTRDYVAPEIIKYDPITLNTDMWCIGIITYVLLSGLLPFSGESWPERSTNIQRVNYNYDDDVFDFVSPEAKEFIDRLLIMPPTRRMSAIECLDHPWLTMKREGSVIYTLERTKRNLRTLLETYRSKWHKAGNVLIAARRLRAPASGVSPGAAPLSPIPGFDPRSSCDWQASRQT